jgi:isoamylase
LIDQANKGWHGVKLNHPDWGDGSHSVALYAEVKREGMRFHLILNAYWEPLEFELPRLESGKWRRWIDTALDSPNDIVPWKTAPPIQGATYRAEARSVVMLYSANNE